MQKKLLLLFFLFVICASGQNSHAASKTDEYDLQEKCRKSASEFFATHFGSGNTNDDYGRTIDTYMNHYNKKLNKCFILIDEKVYPKDQLIHMTESRILFDANENKEYGSAGTMNDGSFYCDMLNKECCSINEWNTLLEPYMEE